MAPTYSQKAAEAFSETLRETAITPRNAIAIWMLEPVFRSLVQLSITKPEDLDDYLSHQLTNTTVDIITHYTGGYIHCNHDISTGKFTLKQTT